MPDHERAERAAEWLREQGFRVTDTTVGRKRWDVTMCCEEEQILAFAKSHGYTEEA